MPSEAIVRAIRDRLCATARLLVLADFDGTLAPLAPEPGAVRLPSEVRETLGMLARSRRADAGIVSGRALADLRDRVGVPGLYYAGCHGLEIEGPGIAWLHPGAARLRGRLRDVAALLQARVGTLPGVLVEPKGLAIALHYRNAAPDVLPRLEAEVTRALGEGQGLTMLRGKMVVEVLPDVRWNKGECVRWVREVLERRAGSPVVTLYMGDDETDEVAFRALDGKAVTVRVGDERVDSAAAHRLADVEDARWLLATIAAETGTGP